MKLPTALMVAILSRGYKLGLSFNKGGGFIAAMQIYYCIGSFEAIPLFKYFNAEFVVASGKTIGIQNNKQLNGKGRRISFISPEIMLSRMESIIWLISHIVSSNDSNVAVYMDIFNKKQWHAICSLRWILRARLASVNYEFNIEPNVMTWLVYRSH